MMYCSLQFRSYKLELLIKASRLQSGKTVDGSCTSAPETNRHIERYPIDLILLLVDGL